MSEVQVTHETGSLVVEKVKPLLKVPPMYKVIIMNDDYTPMDFVVEILMYFFNMNEIGATRVMLQVHTQGKGICGVFTRDIAETKVEQVNSFSTMHEHPLMCAMEAE